jgi:hypothetical protein
MIWFSYNQRNRPKDESMILYAQKWLQWAMLVSAVCQGLSELATFIAFEILATQGYVSSKSPMNGIRIAPNGV